MLDERLLDLDAALRVGRVTAVEGRRVKVAVDKLKNGSHSLYAGAVLRNAGVGGYLKIAKGFTRLIAKVDGEYIHEDRLASDRYGRSVDRIARTLEVSLVGYLEDRGFQRGVRELPLLDNECFVLTYEEFRAVHQFAPPGRPTFRIGALATEPTQSVDLGVDDIFASHIGIFGNTGSGKSYTLAKLYHEIFKQFGENVRFCSTARIVIVDFNGEYVDLSGHEGDRSTRIITDSGLKTVYELTTRTSDGTRLPFSAGALSDPVIWQVLLDATEKTQAPFISRVLNSERWETLLGDADALLDAVKQVVLRATQSGDHDIDRQTVVNLLWEIDIALGAAAPQGLRDLIDRFSRSLGFHTKARSYYWDAANSRTWANDDADIWSELIGRQFDGLELDVSAIGGVDLIRFKLVLQYYEDIASGFSNREHLAPLIKRLTARIPDIKKVIELSDEDIADKPLTIVSLREVNLGMRKVVPMLLCKRLYDDKKKRDPTAEHYLNLVIDEAHNILSTQSTRESDAWRDYRLETFEEIIKEGRKFGVFLTIASQRPHDISETIISQLHNYFLHRLVNDLDVRAVERAVAYLDAVSFESIPILATGTCIVAGVSAQVPVVTRVGRLPVEAEPTSRTMSVVDTWAEDL